MGCACALARGGKNKNPGREEGEVIDLFETENQQAGFCFLNCDLDRFKKEEKKENRRKGKERKEKEKKKEGAEEERKEESQIEIPKEERKIQITNNKK